VAGKTGTLPTLRHEVGVVQTPDRRRYAVAVFTLARSTAFSLPQVDAAIGASARVAVDDIARRSR
jgi:beta-lactamase class A